MKFSWKWLNQLVDLKDIKISEFTKQLTLCGFEIEEIYKEDIIKDLIIDIDITANRQDTCSVIGFAREISTIFNVPLLNNIENKAFYFNHKFITISNLDYSSSKNGLIDLKINTINNIKSNQTPKWLINYLIASSIEPKNCLEDIKNYIQYKWGQDLQIFDISKMNIKSKDLKHSLIHIELSYEMNNIIKTNVQNTPVEILKYKDNSISIMGIETNKEFNCDKNTSNLLLCSSICDPQYIINTTNKLNIKTHLSQKHSKQIPRCDFFSAYNEALLLISYYTKGTISKSYEYHLPYKKPLKFKLHKKHIYQTLGYIQSTDNHRQQLSTDNIHHILEQLNFSPIYNRYEQSYDLVIPPNRDNDIQRPIDVIEEIGRIYGFEKFIGNIPDNTQIGKESVINKTIRKARQILRNNGLHEVIHYSLEDNDKPYFNKILIYNPLQEDLSTLRTSLLHNIINTIQYNTQQKNTIPEIFEIGKIFYKRIEESTLLAGVLGNQEFSRLSWSDKTKHLTWFQAKGFLEEFFEKLNSNISWGQFDSLNQSIFCKERKLFFHPERTATIYNQEIKENIGIFGEINNNLKYLLNVKYPIYLFEINIHQLIKTIHQPKHLKNVIQPYSLYPSVTRDISLNVKDNTNIKSVIKDIPKNPHSLIESIHILNEYYYEDKTKQMMRNISLRITYRAQNRTLTSRDLKQIDNEIMHLLNAYNN